MTMTQHGVGGALAGLGATALVGSSSIVLTVALLGIAYVASLVPDVDHPGSTIARRTVVLHALYRWTFSNPVTWMLFGRSRMGRCVGHRCGIAHSVFGAALSCALLAAPVYLGLRARSVDLSVLAAPSPPASWAWWHEVMATAPGPAPYVAAASVAWLLGYGSHLLLDMLTLDGVALLSPLSSRRFHLLPGFLRRRVSNAS